MLRLWRPHTVLLEVLTYCGAYHIGHIGGVLFCQLVELLTKQRVKPHLEARLDVLILFPASLFLFVHQDIVCKINHNVYPNCLTSYIHSKRFVAISQENNNNCIDSGHPPDYSNAGGLNSQGVNK